MSTAMGLLLAGSARDAQGHPTPAFAALANEYLAILGEPEPPVEDPAYDDFARRSSSGRLRLDQPLILAGATTHETAVRVGRVGFFFRLGKSWIFDLA